MGKIRKQSVLNLVGLQLGQFIGLLNKGVLFPLIFIESKEYWGLIELYYGYSVMIVPLIQFGNTRIITRLLPRFASRAEALLGFVFKRMTINVILGMLLLLVFPDEIAGFTKDSDLFLSYYHLFVIMIGAVFMFDLGQAIATARHQSHIPLWVNNITLRLSSTLVLLFQYFYGFSMPVFLSVMIGIYVLNFGILLLYVLRKEKVEFNNETFTKKERKEFVKFGRVIGLTNVSSTAQNQIMTAIVGGAFGLEVVAIYAFAKNIYSVVEMPGRAVINATTSTVSMMVGNGEMDKVEGVYKKSSLSQFFLGAFILSMILVNIDILLNFFKDDSYYIAKTLILIMGVGKLFDFISGVNANIISNSDYYQFNLYFGIGNLVFQVASAYFLIGEYGLVGIALALAMTLVLGNVVRSVFVYMKFKIHSFEQKHIPLLLYAVAMLAIALLPLPSTYTFTFLKDGVILLSTLLYLKFFSPLNEFSGMLQKIPLIGNLFK